MARTDDHVHHLIKERQLNSDCVTATIQDYACRDDHCHNTTTHIHDCVDYSLGYDCANETTRIDICNSTACRNTTQHIHICVHDIAQRCANADIKIDSCTNGACRNRTTTIHACFNTINVVSAATCAAAAADDDLAVRTAAGATCADNLRTFFAHIFGN